MFLHSILFKTSFFYKRYSLHLVSNFSKTTLEKLGWLWFKQGPVHHRCSWVTTITHQHIILDTIRVGVYDQPIEQHILGTNAGKQLS